jgi:hypothetical protein
MLSVESLKQYIEQLSALPPRKRLEVFRAIQDPTERREIAKALPPGIRSEILAQGMLDGLNRNALKSVARRKPGLAA